MMEVVIVMIGGDKDYLHGGVSSNGNKKFVSVCMAP